MVGVVSDDEVGCDIERNVNALWKLRTLFPFDRAGIYRSCFLTRQSFYTLDLKGKLLYENDSRG